MNDFTGSFSYEKLREVIVNYYKRKGVQLVYPSIDYLKDYLRNSGTTLDYFRISNGDDTSVLNMSNEMVRLFVNKIVTEMGLEFKDVRFGDKVEVRYGLAQDLNINVSEEKSDLEMDDFSSGVQEFSTSINYDRLRELVKEYFKVNKGLELGTISIDYLSEFLVSGHGQAFWVVNTQLGEARFNIPKEQLVALIGEYIKEQGYELSDVVFKNHSIDIKYNMKLDLSLDDLMPEQNSVKPRM